MSSREQGESKTSSKIQIWFTRIGWTGFYFALYMRLDAGGALIKCRTRGRGATFEKQGRGTAALASATAAPLRITVIFVSSMAQPPAGLVLDTKITANNGELHQEQGYI